MTRRSTKGKYETHTRDAVLENIDFLMDHCGLHIDHVAKRLGLTTDAIEKMRERRRVERQRDSSIVEERSEGPGDGKVPELRLASIDGRRVAPPEEPVGS